MFRKLTHLIAFVLVLGAATSGMAADPDPSLEGWWTFDGHAIDLSGNDRHGTLVGTPSFGPGVFGESLELDGDDYVTMDGYKGVLGTNALSITCWVKTSSTTTQQIVHWGTHAGGQRLEFRIEGNTLRISHGSGNVQGQANLTDGEWHHVAATVIENASASSGDVTFYVDGEDDTMVSSDPDTWNIIANPTLDVTIGWRPTQQDRPFIGNIDDVRIYSKVLTQEEIQQIMLSSNSEPYPYALNPNPEDGAVLEATWVNMAWSPGALAVSHNVYLGESFDDVNNGSGDTFVGNQAGATLIVGFPGFPVPAGLAPGTTYYWRIDEVNDADPNSPWKGPVWSFSVPPKNAYNADPVDGAMYVDPDVTLSWVPGFNAKLHHVYFGDNFDDVNHGAATTYKGAMPELTFTPGTLDTDKAYYWRVDEFDGAGTHKGNVMSFSTMPVIDVIDSTLIGWWKFDAGVGDIAPDWSGQGNHGLLVNPNWLSPGWIGQSAMEFGSDSYMAIRNLVLNDANETEVSVSAWVRTSSSGMQTIVSFDRSDYWRFETGSQYVSPGLVGWEVSTSSGVVDLPSQKRIDDGQWHHVAGIFDNGTMTIYFDGARDATAVGGSTFGIGSTRYGFVGSQSEATVFDGDRSGSPGYWMGSMDDVRIYDRALTQDDVAQVMRGDLLLAWGHQPPSGIYDIDAVPSSLTWSPGDMAAQHDVYLGTDEQAVQSAESTDTTGIYRGQQAGTTYTPAEPFEWGQDYFWRIDEINTDGTVSKGGVRAIMVADFRLIDDFESYTDNDADNEAIWQHWIDGFGVPTNGSQVGYVMPPYSEQTIVHDGAQSMPLFYDNTAGVTNSQAELTLTSTRDWTAHGVGVLSLWFRGYPPTVGSFAEGPVGTFTMTAAGSDIAGTADEFHFAYKTLTGPGSITARIDSVLNTHDQAKAGVMIRATLDPNSAHAFACITPGNGVGSLGRTAAGGGSFNTYQADITAPHWVKLERDVAGNFTVSHSTNSAAWQPVKLSAPTAIPMDGTVYIGLALTSHNTAETGEAKFSNVTIAGNAGVQWVHHDVGILGNAAEPLYVGVTDGTGTSAVVPHGDANASAIDLWTELIIDLQALADQGVNLTNVDKIAIGLGSKGAANATGGSGTVFIDDIRLSRPSEEPQP